MKTASASSNMVDFPLSHLVPMILRRLIVSEVPRLIRSVTTVTNGFRKVDLSNEAVGSVRAFCAKNISGCVIPVAHLRPSQAIRQAITPLG
jgi:hypothetical protein